MAVAEWTTNPYPRARTDRKQGLAPPIDFDAGPPQPPRVYPWHVVLSERGNNQRGTVGSKRLIGPALIKRFDGAAAQPLDAGDKYGLIQIFYSASPILEGSGQAEAFPLGCTNIIDLTWRRDDATFANPFQGGLTQGVNSSTALPITALLDYYIPLAEFFIGFSLISRSDAGGSDANGVLLVYEAVGADWWRSLLA